MAKFRIESNGHGTFILSDRGVVCEMLAGYQQTRMEDAREILKGLAALDKVGTCACASCESARWASTPRED